MSNLTRLCEPQTSSVHIRFCGSAAQAFPRCFTIFQRLLYSGGQQQHESLNTISTWKWRIWTSDIPNRNGWQSRSLEMPRMEELSNVSTGLPSLRLRVRATTFAKICSPDS